MEDNNSSMDKVIGEMEDALRGAVESLGTNETEPTPIEAELLRRISSLSIAGRSS